MHTSSIESSGAETPAHIISIFRVKCFSDGMMDPQSTIICRGMSKDPT